MENSRSRNRRRGGLIAVAVLAVLAGLAFVGYQRLEDWRTRNALLAQWPDEVMKRPDLVRYGVALGEPAYAENCASCHGMDMRGDKSRGAPNLADATWLYDQGQVSDIERTILYGIRSGHMKTRNVTDMPALGQIKQLTPDDVKDVTAYTLSLQTKQGDPEVLKRGQAIYMDKGVCYDCHSPDGIGNPDYGTPNLTDADSLFGNDADSTYRSIYDGRHGRCPGWIGALDFATIRGLALYVYEKSHPTTGTAALTRAKAPG
jgi:cytochrome c oxidase cbb3-type subunit III